MFNYILLPSTENGKVSIHLAPPPRLPAQILFTWAPPWPKPSVPIQIYSLDGCDISSFQTRSMAVDHFVFQK